jgi:S1-C subfamily serine protease
VFPAPPLGLTVVRGGGGSSWDSYHSSESATAIDIAPVVVRSVAADSHAHLLGLSEGDCIVGLEGQWVAGYEDFIRRIQEARYPLTLVLRRHRQLPPGD